MAVKTDYLSRDFNGFRTSLLQYAQSVFPEWQQASEGDFGVVLVDLFSYMGDIISYYTDRAQFENYLPTATQRDSIINLALMLGYVPNSGSPARGTVDLTTLPDTAATTVPAGLQLTTNRVDALDGPVYFETTEEVVLPANPVGGGATPQTVDVVEGATVNALYLGPSTGQPGQVFALPNTGVYRDTIQIFVEDATGSITITPDGGSPVTVQAWVQTDRLLGKGSGDRVFESRVATDATYVLFGDALSGAIPATGLKIYATYRHGVGALGNLAAGVVRIITSTDPALAPVRIDQDADGTYKSSAMTGGTDEESNESIRENAPRAFRTQDRVVTVDDFKSTALSTPGVRSVSVVIESFTNVTLYVTGPDGGTPTATLKQAVADQFEGKLMAGVTLTVSDPTFSEINFGSVTTPIKIYLKTGYSATTVLEAAKRALAKFMSERDPSDPLVVGDVYNALNAIDGAQMVDIPVFTRPAPWAQTNTATITPKPWEVLTLGSITITVV